MELKNKPVEWSIGFHQESGRWLPDLAVESARKGQFLEWKKWMYMKVAVVVNYKGKTFHVLPENLTFLNETEDRTFANEIEDKGQVAWMVSYKKGGLTDVGPAGVGYFQEWTTIDDKKVAEVKGLNGKEIFVEPEHLKFIGEAVVPPKN